MWERIYLYQEDNKVKATLCIMPMQIYVQRVISLFADEQKINPIQSIWNKIAAREKDSIILIHREVISLKKII